MLNFPIYTELHFFYSKAPTKLKVVFLKILAFRVCKIPSACEYGRKTLFSEIHLIAVLYIILFKH